MFKETLNKMGYQALLPDDYTKYFVEYALTAARKDPSTQILEVGCGFGVSAIELINQGVRVCCNDLAPAHLEHIKKNIISERLNCFSTMIADIRNIPLPQAFTFTAILCSRVLHFFDGEGVSKALMNMNQLLKEDGRLYVIVETPFLKNWENFLPHYYSNKKRGKKWPGLASTKVFESAGHQNQLPNFLNFFDIDTMSYALMASGFTINQIGYINRAKTFPDALLLDGRESLGVVATKIRHVRM